MELFQGLVVSAILLGCMYTLVAIGFSLFFGVMDVVVFCCGDIAILGSFTIMGAWVVLRSAGLFEALPFAVCVALLVLAGALLCAFMGLVTYRASIAPFRESSDLMPLLSTIAMGTVIKEVLGLLFKPVVNALSAAAGSASALSVTSGRNPQGFPKLLEPLTPGWWDAPLDFTKAAIIAVTVVILTLLFLFLNKTKMGLSMQAVAQNKELSIMTGINVSRVIVITFLTGGVLLAIGGFLMGNYQGIMSFDNGAMYGAKGFSAAVVGGLRNTWGAVAGGMLLAFVEVFVAGYAPGGMAYANIVAFVVVVVFIVFKPEGIIGEKSVEKV
ncbi:MAG: branched-chain amino acid ABC transporter permease [Synergistaceae bacterium]|jgi:branched-chain amino acid transport system permease protein|nr:branched-chain amino acid ABC transporter permease [Synergistaceae bacterium]